MFLWSNPSQTQSKIKVWLGFDHKTSCFYDRIPVKPSQKLRFDWNSIIKPHVSMMEFQSNLNFPNRDRTKTSHDLKNLRKLKNILQSTSKMLYWCQINGLLYMVYTIWIIPHMFAYICTQVYLNTPISLNREGT